MTPLGLIAGGGSLPGEIARHCRTVRRPLFVVRLKGFAGPDLADFPGVDVGLAELGKCIAALKGAGVRAVCLAGIVGRPDFARLAPDLRGLSVLPRAIVAATKGDDALLRLLVSEFERDGFAVEGAHQVMDDLLLPPGVHSHARPTRADLADAELALTAAREIGSRDVGQAAVVRRGRVLATETSEGTDALLTTVAGRSGTGGVLAKAPKPIQELRVDLPTVGPATMRAAAAAGLAGVVGEAGGVLVLDRTATLALADELGLFVMGVEPPAR